MFSLKTEAEARGQPEGASAYLGTCTCIGLSSIMTIWQIPIRSVQGIYGDWMAHILGET